MPKKETSDRAQRHDLNDRLTRATEIASSRVDLDQEEIFIRGIVHDINNNLMAILASCDHLEASQSLMWDLPEHLKLIQKHVHYSSSLLRGLVNSQNTDRPMVMTMGELNHFVESILTSLSLIMGRDTMVELGSVVTSPVQVNRNPLLRVLLQLVRNVAEAEISHPLAYISVREVGDWCEISVSDNGPGIVGINPKSIFEPGFTTAVPRARGGMACQRWRVPLKTGAASTVLKISMLARAAVSGSGCRWPVLPIQIPDPVRS